MACSSGGAATFAAALCSTWRHIARMATLGRSRCLSYDVCQLQHDDSTTAMYACTTVSLHSQTQQHCLLLPAARLELKPVKSLPAHTPAAGGLFKSKSTASNAALESCNAPQCQAAYGSFAAFRRAAKHLPLSAEHISPRRGRPRVWTGARAGRCRAAGAHTPPARRPPPPAARRAPPPRLPPRRPRRPQLLPAAAQPSGSGQGKAVREGLACAALHCYRCRHLVPQAPMLHDTESIWTA